MKEGKGGGGGRNQMFARGRILTFGRNGAMRTRMMGVPYDDGGREREGETEGQRDRGYMRASRSHVAGMS